MNTNFDSNDLKRFVRFFELIKSGQQHIDELTRQMAAAKISKNKKGKKNSQKKELKLMNLDAIKSCKFIFYDMCRKSYQLEIYSAKS